MYLDFGALPPEVNSGRIYAGPGSGSMLAAAAAWEKLGAELHTTAGSYESVTSGLVAGPWGGPAAAAMLAAAQPYVTWLRGTGAQAEQTARQATAVVEAYSTARATVVPPPLITANRVQLAHLLATNVLGQNFPAIAEVEREYAEMWAQDVAAMYRYASCSAAASALSPFSQPPQTANPSGQGAQAAATAAATNATASGSAGSLASALASVNDVVGQVSPYTGVTTQAMSATMTGWSGTANLLSNINNAIGLIAFAAENPSGLAEILNPTLLAPASLGLGGVGLTSSTGNALKIGGLSVPHAWAMPVAPATLASSVTPAAMALPASGLAGSPAVAGGLPGTAFGETMLGTLAGRGLTAAAGRAASRRRTVVPRSPAAG
ncbi:MAG TPA: PPE family protein [Mycobacterium sp.]|nr:PPE family protein [Mycobacterium sp.]